LNSILEIDTTEVLELINKMSQDPNLNNASYPLQQITKDQQYPCQQSGEDAQQPGNYDKNLPEKSSDDGQKETLFQPPIFLPHPDFPKGKSFVFFL
jgi:hypothetical protein